MKKIYKYYLPSLMALGLVSCSVETPFQSETMQEGYGQLSKLAFELEVSGAQSTTTRAENSDILKDFNIVIQTSGANPVTRYSEKYSDLPDVVTLPAGKYTVTATYGENQEAEFEKPHYLGVSDEFEVKNNEITTDIGKISCKLNNIKVSVYFHPTLVSHMDEKAYVEVKVNDGKALNFTTEHTENDMAGYFRHNDECSMIATFKGIVDGVELNEIKTLGKVEKGNHYKITFVRHEYNGEESGDIVGGVNVDATVTVVNYDRNITIEEDEILNDNERPKEDDLNQENPGTDPEDPNDPDTPDTPDEPKESSLVVELVDSTVVFGENEKNIVDENTTVKIHVKTDNGLTYFFIDIESEDELLAAMKLDLINTGDEENIESLRGIGLLDDNESNLKGCKDKVIDVSEFMSFLEKGTHIFHVHISDVENPSESDTIEKILVLVKE